MTPDSLRTAADRIAAHLDPDGALPDDHARARRRYLHLGPQDADGMSDIRGLLDPRARATLDAVFAKLAAPHATSTTPGRQRHHGNPQNTGNTSEQRNNATHRARTRNTQENNDLPWVSVTVAARKDRCVHPQGRPARRPR